MNILETERVKLFEATENDAEFMLDLLNQPSFIKYIGDRNVRTIDESKEFIRTRYLKSYQDHGYGLYIVALKGDNTSIGVCGFVKRDNFQFPDLGFAFLPRFEGAGYAVESARGVVKYGQDILGFSEVLAITTPDNDRSGRLLEKLDFKYRELIEMPNNEILKLYSWRKS